MITHAVRHHHLVVLVLDDVAVPDVQAGDVEGRVDAGDLTRVGDYGVLPAGLRGLRRQSGPASAPVADQDLPITTLNFTRCRWMGCPSTVRFHSSQVSVALRPDWSAIGSDQRVTTGAAGKTVVCRAPPPWVRRVRTSRACLYVGGRQFRG